MAPTCAILTISDSCFAKEKPDLSGPELLRLVKKKLNFTVTNQEIVPDDEQIIAGKLEEYVSKKINLVLTTGGTGLSPRDVTPEATRAVIQKEIPGITHGINAGSLKSTPMGMLSRAVAGVKNQTLIINFPGSKKAANECFGYVKDVLTHAVAVLSDQKESVTKHHQHIQNGGRSHSSKNLETKLNNVDIAEPSQNGEKSQSSENLESKLGKVTVTEHIQNAEESQSSENLESKVSNVNVADRPRTSTYPMLEVSEAIQLVLDEANFDVGTEKIKLEDCLHRVLAEEVKSREDVPPFDASIKDGYAVIASDGSGPRKIRKYIAAGDAPETQDLQSGEAIRIGTGAPIPAGADAVVQVEDTKILEKENGEELVVSIDQEPTKGQDIRVAGTDLKKDTTVLLPGERLSFAHIGVLASLGHSFVTVYKRVSVALLSTGNEVKEHFEELKPGQIRDTNRPSLKNLLQKYSYHANDYGIIKDDPSSTMVAVSTALKNNDILVTSGGVSMGEFDFMKRVLVEDLGAKVHFGRVNMKPGKPTTFATLTYNGAKKLIFGLPGNPVSANVTCVLYVLPLLRHLEKARIWKFPIIPYVTDVAKSSDPRPEYVRVITKMVDGSIVAFPNGHQISSRLNSLVGANGLMLTEDGKSKEIMLIDELLVE